MSNWNIIGVQIVLLFIAFWSGTYGILPQNLYKKWPLAIVWSCLLGNVICASIILSRSW